MANPNRPIGAELHGRGYPLQEYIAAATIYPGDFLTQEAAGKVTPATASQALVGVAMTYAASAGKVLVANHPDQLFRIQADDSTVDAQTDIGLNYDIVVNSPDTNYRRSGHLMDASTQATLATLPLRLIEVCKDVDNALGDKCKCIVKINNHQLNGGTGAIGV